MIIFAMQLLFSSAISLLIAMTVAIVPLSYLDKRQNNKEVQHE